MIVKLSAYSYVLVIRAKYRPTTECIDSRSVKLGLNWCYNNFILKILEMMEFPF